MAVVRVLRTPDRRWRVEQHADGWYDLRLHGALVLQRTSWQRVAERLGRDGIDADDLIED